MVGFAEYMLAVHRFHGKLNCCMLWSRIFGIPVVMIMNVAVLIGFEHCQGE